MADRGLPAQQLALVERRVESLQPIAAVEVAWLEGSLAGDRAIAASDVVSRAIICKP
jgi:hypothetical protein